MSLTGDKLKDAPKCGLKGQWEENLFKPCSTMSSSLVVAQDRLYTRALMRKQELSWGDSGTGKASHLQQPGWIKWGGLGGAGRWLCVGLQPHLGLCYRRSRVCSAGETQQTSRQLWSSFPVSEKHAITPATQRFTYIIRQPTSCCCRWKQISIWRGMCWI